jgi:DNA-binding transcriptional LysR family regulator
MLLPPPREVRPLDYKSLQYVIAVAEEGSFGRAAERVHLTQSAVSRSIIALEEQLNVSLFDRTPTGAVPTAEGLLYIESAHRILAEVRALEHKLARAKQEIAGTVAFGVAPSLTVICLPHLFTFTVTTLPQLKLVAKVDVWEQLCQQLRAGTTDFFVGIRDSIKPIADFDQIAIGSVGAAGIFCRREHPLAQNPHVTGADLRAYPTAMAGLDRTLESHGRHILQMTDDDRSQQPTLVCDNLFVMQRVLAGTDTLLMTSRRAVAELTADGTLVEIHVERPAGEPAPGEVVLVLQKGRSLSPATQHIIDQLRQFFAD